MTAVSNEQFIAFIGAKHNFWEMSFINDFLHININIIFPFINIYIIHTNKLMACHQVAVTVPHNWYRMKSGNSDCTNTVHVKWESLTERYSNFDYRNDFRKKRVVVFLMPLSVACLIWLLASVKERMKNEKL